jgi:DNA-binding transcriptional regulator GbsR (MarR family)
MKKKLESELVSIAHRILKLKGKEDVIKMHTEAKELFEKLSVLKFAQENFDDKIPSIGNDSSFFSMLDTAFNNKFSDNIEHEDSIYTNIEENQNEPITEPLMETIKDLVAQMPHETQQVDDIFEKAEPKKPVTKQKLEDITSGFEDMPIFEPVKKEENTASNEKKSLNDKLKSGGLKIGLNDKIAFIKHLFGGENEDYDRVISQLNTKESYKNAKEFIETMVKPDYNNWVNKEEFETRFMEIIESKFE